VVTRLPATLDSSKDVGLVSFDASNRGDRSENLERAIACFEAALRVRTERDFPHEWAMTQNNLGNAYANLPTGDRGENLRRAIACFEDALRIYTERDSPQEYATTRKNLDTAMKELADLQDPDNV
jgi:tetratricopeptide (TPR) repeat protein